MNITEFRKQYPQYEDMSDKQLADSLYQKHYSDIPRAEFDSKFTPKSFMDKAKKFASDAVESTAKGVAGMSENLLNQATQFVSFMPAALGSAGAELAQAVVQERLPSLDKYHEKFGETMKAATWQPTTESGKQQVETTQRALESIPQAVDEIDSYYLDDAFKRKFPNTYAATQTAGGLAPYMILGKGLHTPAKPNPGRPADIPFDPSRRINQEAKAVQPDLNLGDVQYTSKPRVEDAAATNRWYEAEANTRDEVANAMANGRERVARDKTLGVPVGEPTGGPVVDRYVKEPQLNDMPQPQTVQGLLPYDKMGRIDEAKSTFDLDAQRLAEEIANAKEERAVSMRNEQLGYPDEPTMQNSSHDKPLVIGTPKEGDHVAEAGYKYRSVSPAEIESIAKQGAAYPPPGGKSKGGRTNVKHWATADGRLFYNPTQDVIRVRAEDFNPNHAIPRDRIEYWNKETNQFEPVVPKEGEPVKANIPSVSIEDAKVAKAEVVKQLLTEKSPDRISQLEIQLDQYNQIIKGEATYKDFQPTTSEVRGAETQPSVTKATVGEVLDMIRKGEINSKEHTTLYPDGVRNPDSTAYVFNKKSLGKDIVTAKKEVVQGGDLESKWLGKKEEVATVPKVEPTEVVEPKAEPTKVSEPKIEEPAAPKNVDKFNSIDEAKIAIKEPTTTIPAVEDKVDTLRKDKALSELLYTTGAPTIKAIRLRDAGVITTKELNKLGDAFDSGYIPKSLDDIKAILEDSKEIKVNPESNLEASDGIVEDNSTHTTGPTDAELAAIEKEIVPEAQDDLFIPEKGIDYGVGKERKSKAEERLARIKAASEAKAATKETAPLENAELYAGIPLSRLPKPLNQVIVGFIKGGIWLVNKGIPATARMKGLDLVSLPQRIAASGKYPTYTRMYNEAYRVWEETRTSITNNLFEEVVSPDNPLDSRMSAKDMRKLQNKLSSAEKLDFIRLLKDSEYEGRLFSPDELLGKENPFGRPVSENVAKLYDSTRKFYQDVAMEDLNQNLQTAIHSFKDEPWFSSLKDWIDNEWTREDVEALAEERNVLVHKDALTALDTVNRVRENNAVIKQGYETNPQYFPHVRPNGEYAVRVFEMNDEALAVKDRYASGDIKTKEDYLKELRAVTKEVYMRTAYNEIMQRGIEETVRKNPQDDIFGFPTNYSRMLEERGADSLVEGVDYEIISDRIYPTNEEVWIYSGSMPAKVSLMESMIQGAFSDGARLKKIGKSADRGTSAKELSQALTDDVREAVHTALMKELTDAQLSRGFGRHKMQRAGHLIEGFDMEDPVGTALNHARTMAGYHTKARYAMTAARLFKDASYDEHILLSRFLQDSLGNENVGMAKAGALIRQGLVFTQLAYRLVAPLINLTQMFAWGAPEMAGRLKREGIQFKGAADKLITKAATDIARQWEHDFTSKNANPNKHLTPMERKAIDDFSRTGAAEASNIREVSGLGEGAVSQGLTKATEWGMKPFSISEIMNREATFLATFREYSKAGIPFHEAFEKAKNLSLEVNIDASKHNNPGLVRRGGALIKSFYTFGRYSHSFLSWVFQQAAVHENVGPAARSLLVLASIGGVSALPFGNEINDVAEKLFGKSYRLDLTKYFKEQGEKTGSPRIADAVEDFVMHGAAGSIFRVDVSKNVAPSVPVLSNLIMNGSFDQAAAGPISSVFQRGSRMGQAISRGDTSRAIENIPILPQGLANPLAAYRQYSQGVTTAQGKPIRGTDGSALKMTGPEALVKGVVGATPLRIGREQEIASSQFTLKEHYQDKVKNLRSKWVNSPEDRIEIKKELREISKSVKEYGLDLKVPKRFEKWEKPSREEKRGKALYRRGDAN